jgi:DNA polymerase III subunit delta
MQTLYHEIEKLTQHACERKEIELVDVESLVIPSIRSRVFDLMDAIAENHKAEAMRLLDNMIVMREPEQKIFIMMAKQGGKMLQASRLKHAGVRYDQIPERLGMNPWSAKKLIAASDLLTESQLKQFVLNCAEMDMAVKGGRMKLRTAMEVIIAGI